MIAEQREIIHVSMVAKLRRAWACCHISAIATGHAPSPRNPQGMWALFRVSLRPRRRRVEPQHAEPVARVPSVVQPPAAPAGGRATKR